MRFSEILDKGIVFFVSLNMQRQRSRSSNFASVVSSTVYNTPEILLTDPMILELTYKYYLKAVCTL